jgi:serine/threonine protein kinase
VSLVGPRKIGKTSLLFHLQALNRGEVTGEGMDTVYAYVDGQAHQETEPSAFYSEILRKTHESLAPEDKSILHAERPKEEMNLIGLRRAIHSLTRREIRPVVLIDEFDVFCENPSFDLPFFNGLRSLATLGLIYVTASKRRLFQLNLDRKTLGSPFFNYFRKLYLGLFDAESAVGLIRDPSAGCGVSFDERTRKEILHLAGRHPFFLQQVCHFAFDLYRERERELREADFKVLRANSKRELKDQMASYWKDLDPEAQQILLKVARDEALPQGSEVVLDDLRHRALLVRSNGAYQIFSALFKDYVCAQSRPKVPRPEKWLDRFQIEEELGRGGMSIVRKAYQPALDRYVAFKELRPQADVLTKYADRFHREALSIARLDDHPNILPVYDFYQEGDRAYIVMKYASGGSLADLLEGAKKPFDPIQAVEIVIHVGRALGYAHRQGVIHRDVKPANIFMGGEEGDWPLLGDFGLSLSKGDVLVEEEGMTGSADYIAPEQSKGEAESRSDIYSLGIVLYHLLVGEVPYAEESRPVDRLVKRLADGVPAPRLRNPQILECIGRIIQKATASNPKDRYQTADEMVEDLGITLEYAKMKLDKRKKMREYVDFDLHIAPDGHVTANSCEGQAIADISTEVLTSIDLALNLIEARQTNADLLKQLGQELYNWLFPGSIHTHFQQTEAVARREGAKVRLRLRIEVEDVASLPLEFLYRELGGYFLAVNPATVLSRYLNLPLPPKRVRRRKGPLHMLVIIADPTDQTRLNPDEWEILIRDALVKPLETGQMMLRTVKQATRREIRKALLEQEPDIIQFVGHGIYQSGKGYLALVDENTGETWLVDDEVFANLYLGFDDHLGLISLATCESAKSDDPQGFLGIAPQLVQRGVPAVVAMHYKVYVKTAKVFLEDFYTSVSARRSIDWAVQSGRKAISLEFGLDNREFVTPVLYMRAEDGEIF